MKALLKISALLLPWLVFPGANCWAACTLEVQSVLLGSYDAIAANAVDGTGAIRVQCTPAADYTLSLSAGQGSYASANAVLDSCACSLQVYMNPLNPVHRSSPQTLSHVCVAPTVANVHLLPAPICLSNTTALFAVQ